MSARVFPWIYAYTEDPTVGAQERLRRMGRIPLRPVLTVTMVGPVGRQRTVGLVDSGSEHTLAGPWLARATGCRPGPEDPELEIGIGGRNRVVRFTEVTLELPPPAPLGDQDAWTWSAEVGIIDYWDPPWPMLLGQVGFFDQFTVTMNRHGRVWPSNDSKSGTDASGTRSAMPRTTGDSATDRVIDRGQPGLAPSECR